MHDARHVANEFIRLGREMDNPFTHLQIQKLVYFAHGWMLALYDRPLIKQGFEAWRYGPACRALYSALAMYGKQRIRDVVLVNGEVFGDDFSQEELDLIRQVSKVYGQFSGIQLSRLTHEAGTPWSLAKARDDVNIPDEDIRAHCVQIAESRVNA